MKKSPAIGTRINSNKFYYGSKTQTFFADHSELFHAKLDAFGQLWGDEGTKGFVMVSARTTEEVPFELDHIEREADGDVRMWRFKPSRHEIALNPKLERVSVIVFNT